MPREHIHFVTGRLAEHSLREIVEPLAQQVGFDYTIDVLPITVAALMTPEWIARRISTTTNATRVLVPGYCTGDLTPIETAAGVPVERGPRDLRQLPEFFGREPPPADYGAYDIEIIAEINHCPRLTLAEIRAVARQLAADGADVIDVGCEPDGPWPGVADTVRALRDDGHRVSIDSLDPREIEPAVNAGAELVLSVNSSNRDGRTRLGLRSGRGARRSAHARRTRRNGRGTGRGRRAAADRSGARADRLRLRRQPRPLSASPRALSRRRNDDGHRQPHGADRRRFGGHQRRAARLLPGARHSQRAHDASHQLGPIERARM